jgi:hypothetical protein
MKKTTITITTLCLFAILSCGIVIHLACKHEDSCDGCSLTNAQLSFICCSGSEAIFKNDITNALDTLYASAKTYGSSVCSDYCDKGYGSVNVGYTFTHFGSFGISISNYNEAIPIIGFTAKGIYGFDLNVPTQTVTVNGTTYNDVYSVQQDSTKIFTVDKQAIPWKLYYSQSQGFVRFYMVNGQTWSKL